MRIPLTKYGTPQVIIYPIAILLIMAILLAVGLKCFCAISNFIIQLPLLIVLIWALSFFRDPKEYPPKDASLLLAPADGKITDIDTVEENDFIKGKALRVGIFLSIFNTHINRAPADVKIENIIYKKGKFKNALNPDSAKVNESNDLWMTKTNSPNEKLIVRQISGAIARRIVCKTAIGQKLNGGQKFGMIKFGSRTELYLPYSDNVQPVAKIGQKVKAGLTPLVRYK